VNNNVDSKFGAHDTFLEELSPGTLLKAKRLENQMILKSFGTRKPKHLTGHTLSFHKLPFHNVFQFCLEERAHSITLLHEWCFILSLYYIKMIPIIFRPFRWPIFPIFLLIIVM